MTSDNSRDETTTFTPKFGADGLLTAVAIDADNGQLLMVAHMNAEAVEKTLETGFAHYWSRSRKALWRKGETSGNHQEIVEIRTDCDQDAMQLLVRQTGPACHTGRKSCFYRVVDKTDGGTTLKFSE